MAILAEEKQKFSNFIDSILKKGSESNELEDSKQNKNDEKRRGC